ncbi:hypothetical protein JD844_003161 [Phrynosoma platyrhinos]|uniref:CAS1 domain containing 1 n=1 Tax=Phrynosoma platyrhinos TaxID=52577 RepID=A0ABQ7TCH5_PHRPL|nr:hypothetical protein JD844_003161 [Phrynosoma platyrhinos]
MAEAEEGPGKGEPRGAVEGQPSPQQQQQQQQQQETGEEDVSLGQPPTTTSPPLLLLLSLSSSSSPLPQGAEEKEEAEGQRRLPEEEEEEDEADSSRTAAVSPAFPPWRWWRRQRQRRQRLFSARPSASLRCPCAPAARSLPHCCHGGAKMAALAYTLGKREINHYFSVRSAKALALGAVLLLAACHALSRRYQGGDSCEYLLSSGRFLGEKVWQPHSCMMHKYKQSEAKDCLRGQHITFIGDSRIRQLFYSFVKLINPQIKEEGNKHGNIHFEDKSSSSSLKVDFLWYPEVNSSMKQCIKSWTEGPSPKPNIIIAGAATWSIKIHNGSNEALTQYKINITSIAPLLENLAKTSSVYWVLQDPVYEEMLSESRKMITNEKIDAYNEAAISILNSSSKNSKAKVKVFSASRLIAEETIIQSSDGLHLPESSRETSAMILINIHCNNIVKPIDGSCCQPRPPLTLIQKLAFCFFASSVIGYLILVLIRRNHHWKNKPCTDMESGEEKKAATNSPAVSILETLLQCLCKLGLIMGYFYMCDRANLFMKENKFYTHSSFFIPIIYILVLGIFYTENTKETKVLNREQTDEWKGWMQLVILIYHISGASTFLPVYMHIRVLVAAYLFQTGYGHFSYFWIKGDFGIYRVCQVLFRLNFLVVVLCIVMDRPYQFYYFVPLVSVWFMIIYVTLALWPQIVQKKANGNCFWHFGLLLKLVFLFICIYFLAYSQGTFEKIFSVWPLSKCFELDGSIYEWWFRWKLDRYTYSIWASSCKNKAECNEMHPSVSVVQILAFILIRNIPGYVRSVYSSFFAWFGRISLEASNITLFCLKHKN